MKSYKAFALLLAIVMILACAGCGAGTASSSEETSLTETETVTKTEEITTASADYKLSSGLNIAVLKGPTGIGMAQLFGMSELGYNVSLFDSPDQVTAKLISGEVDVAAVPSNLGAVLFNKTGGQIKSLAVNTGGTLYLLQQGVASITSLEQVKGMDIWASGQGAVPEFVLSALLAKAGLSTDDVNIHWMASHTDVISTMATVNGGLALLPEPHVSIAEAQNEMMYEVLDLNELWNESFGSDMPMGILVARSEILDSRAEDVKTLLSACEQSALSATSNVDEAAALVTELGIVGSAAIAKKAIPRCNIIFITGEEMKSTLEGFYNTLFELAPASVGGALPTAEYYY